MVLRKYTADDEYDRRVERVRTACNLSDDVDVLRLAMSTMFILVDHVGEGGRIVLESKYGKSREFILLPGGGKK